MTHFSTSALVITNEGIQADFFTIQFNFQYLDYNIIISLNYYY